MLGTKNIKRQNMESLAKYQRSLWNNPRLTYLFFELTDCCNLKCKHCGSSCLSDNHHFLSFDTVKKVLNDVSSHYDCSGILVCLTGGEPLLNRDVFKIIDYSRRLGYSVGMTTNGTLITKSVARKLIDAGLETMSISIDGFGNTHNSFRGNGDAFSKALFGAQNMQALGLNPEITTVFHKGNLQEIDLLYDFLIDKGFDSWKVTCIDPIGRAKKHPEMLLDGNDFKKLLNFVKSKRFSKNNRLEINMGCSHYLGINYEKTVRDFYFQCGAGTQVASIMANGDVGACLDIERTPRTIQGNVFKESFVDVWKNLFAIFREDKSLKSRQCQSCKEKNICLGDSTHTWDFEKNQPHYCVYKMLEE